MSSSKKKKSVLQVRVLECDVILMIYAYVRISTASGLTLCLLLSITLSCSTIRYPSDVSLEDILLYWKLFYRRFLKTCLYETRDVVLAWRNSSMLWPRYLAAMDSKTSRKLGGQIWSAKLKENRFLLWAAWRNTYAQSLPRLVARFQAAVTKVGAEILKCARENTVRRSAFSGQRPLRTPAVTTRPPWFDCLISCCIRRWRVP
jgi:hypothetical protein